MPAGSVIESRIDGEFDGWTGTTVFKLQNGQYWQQVSYAYTYYYAYSPSVTIVMDGNGYKMHVDGVDSSIVVQLIDVVVDSQIVNDFNGWNGDTIFDMANGQIWQQAGPGVTVHVAARPNALIYRRSPGFEMSVQGVDSTVSVKQLQ